ncbi:SDR family NAD(P)-dependent oxidoreductase [Paenibacillus sp. y28]|uniref:SDR family NAD(P)-dependent oxidoreductase n=1 Tax=Paenibacillus sp. y28 TaxID=3129110 RepID=UPI003015C805
MAFTGKTVLITGGGKGIGLAVASAYAGRGAKVIIVDKDPALLMDALKALVIEGGEVHAEVLDVSRPDQVEAFFQRLPEAYGRIDILINNAGFGIFKPLYELTVQEWDDVLHTNLRGTFLCAKEAARIMRMHGGGAIVNLASTRAAMSEPSSEAYAASKGGIVALTHALALSLGPDRIRVNAISPGWIETGDYGSLRPVDHEQHPAGRVGKPEDIARACFYLTDPDNDFVTGINLVVDGGMTRKMMYEE